MHRSHLLQILAVHQPFDENEAIKLQEMQRFIRAHTDCFERTLSIGHMTGSAWIIDLSRTHALLTHHRKLERWLQLGGHADGDANLLRVAWREAQEESGLTEVKPLTETIFDVDIHPIPARGAEPQHLHYDVRFLFEADRTQPLLLNHESKALAWVELAQVAALNADDSIARMVAKSMRLGEVQS